MVTISGKQLTVIWHIKNLMGSCKDDFMLTKFSCYLAGIYGTKLSMHTGRKHNYLGMEIEFNEDDMLEVSMITYLKNITGLFPKEMLGKASSPAAEHLFAVRDKNKARGLEEERVLVFHHMVVQLLYMCMRAQQDIQMVVAFLSTRAKSPDEDSWGNLKRIPKYLNRTKYLRLKLSVNSLGMLNWYIDGSHNVHMDFSGHG
jgi:hypothetical protein